MATLAAALLALSEEYPAIFEFARALPFGLAAEETEVDDVTIQVHPTYCYLSANPEMGAEVAIPGLLRLAAASIEGQAVQLRPATTTLDEEVTWFYCYARSIGLTGISPSRLVPQGTLTRWASIAADLIGKRTFNILDAIQATIILQYEASGAVLLSSRIPSYLTAAWKVGEHCSSLSEFRDYWLRAGLPFPSESQGTCFLLPEPKKRVVVHHVVGRQDGVLATTDAPWIATRKHLLELLRQSLRRPLLFESHDRDRPVGLIENPHLHDREDGQTELHANILIIDEDYWQRRDSFHGFSLGLQHE